MTARRKSTDPRQLNPTETRLRVAGWIAAGQVYTYTWTTKVYRQATAGDASLGSDTVTRPARALLTHRLAEKLPVELASDRVPLRLTDAGRAWRAKHTPIETAQPSAGVL